MMLLKRINKFRYNYIMHFTEIPPQILFGLAIRQKNWLIHAGAGFAEEAQTYHAYKFKKVIWIEANIALKSKIAQQIEKYPNQSLVSCALWDVEGESLDLNISSNIGSSSLLNPEEHLSTFPNISFDRKYSIKTSTLDSLALPVPSGSTLIMDLQGAEARVLKGASKLLQNIDYIYSEFSLVELYKNGTYLEDLKQILDNDFELLIKESDKSLGYGNALFVRKKNYINSTKIKTIWSIVKLYRSTILLMRKVFYARKK